MTNGAFSSYLQAKALDHLFGGVIYNAPAHVYLGLFTAGGGLEANNPAQATEVAGGGYARQEVVFNPSQTLAGVTTAANAGAALFPTASGDWGVITHGAVLDAASGGNVLFWFEFDTPQTVYLGDQVKVEAGGLVLGMD